LPQTSKQKAAEVYERFSARLTDPSYKIGEGVIVDIARKNRFSPALTAKLVIEEDLTRSTSSSPSKSQVAPLTKDTNLIEDGALAYEVLVSLKKLI